MTLLEYMESSKLSIDDISSILEISPYSVTELLYEINTPSQILAQRIQLITKQKVKATQWYDEKQLSNISCKVCNGKGKIDTPILFKFRYTKLKVFCDKCKGTGYVGHSSLFDDLNDATCDTD